MLVMSKLSAFGAGWPTTTEPNAAAVGLASSAGSPPAPVSRAVSVVAPKPDSATVKVDVSGPARVGVSTTITEHIWPAGTAA